MTRAHALSVVLALAAVAAAPAPGGERRFAASGFDEVTLASSDDVRIVPGAYSVSATGDPAALAALSVEVRDGALRIGRRPGSHHDHGARVTVALPALRGATLAGSGNLQAAGVAGPAFTLRLNGSGNVALPGLAVREARLMLGGSGSITADGRVERLAIELAGSGNVSVGRLAADSLAVTSGGSGSVTASATRSAAIRGSGSGDVRVLGHPACAVTAGGSGRITCG